MGERENGREKECVCVSECGVCVRERWREGGREGGRKGGRERN